MKVMFVNHAMHCGGTDRVVAKLIEIFTKYTTYELSLVTLRPKVEDYFSIPESVKRYELGYDSNDSVKSGIAYFDFKGLNTLKELRTVIKKVEPDIIISNWTSINCMVLLASSFLKMKIFAYEHIHYDSPKLVWKILRRIFYPFADTVLALTESDKDKYKKFCNVKKILNPLTLNNDRNWRAISQRENLILAVGRLEEQKGFDLLLMAFQPIFEKYPNWKLCIVGDGSQREKLHSLAYKLGVSERVEFAGSQQDVGQYYDRAKQYVLSSRFEGFGLVILEAQLAQVPVIAFDCPTGPKDIIEDQINGMLVTNGDIKMLSSKMEELITNERKCSLIISGANGTIRNFSDESIINQWRKLLEF